MSRIQRLLQRILPEKWASDMERESKAWHIRCDKCGHERSVWEMGGVRWKASGTRLYLARCPQCGQHGQHTLYRHE